MVISSRKIPTGSWATAVTNPCTSPRLLSSRILVSPVVPRPSASAEESSTFIVAGIGSRTVKIPPFRTKPSPTPVEMPPCTMTLLRIGVLRTPSAKLMGTRVSEDTTTIGVIVNTAMRIPPPGAMVCPANGASASMITPSVTPSVNISGKMSSASAALPATARSLAVTMEPSYPIARTNPCTGADASMVMSISSEDRPTADPSLIDKVS